MKHHSETREGTVTLATCGKCNRRFILNELHRFCPWCYDDLGNPK